MKPQTFRIVLICLAFTITILIFSGLALYLVNIKKPNTCPAPIACPIQKCPVIPKQEPIDARDRRVLSDPLYPALNRTDASTFTGIANMQRINTNNTNNDSIDSYRLLGYLSNTQQERDAGMNNWKLFGRMKDRHQGEYYIIPANNNIDLKLPLTSDVVIGERLRDTFSLPPEMQFNSPMLNQGPYKFTEMPKGDIGSRYM